MLVLLDTTILTNFARVGHTQLMTELWGEQVCTTVHALHEYQVGISAAGLPPLLWKQLRLVKLFAEEAKHRAAKLLQIPYTGSIIKLKSVKESRLIESTIWITSDSPSFSKCHNYHY